MMTIPADRNKIPHTATIIYGGNRLTMNSPSGYLWPTTVVYWTRICEYIPMLSVKSATPTSRNPTAAIETALSVRLTVSDGMTPGLIAVSSDGAAFSWGLLNMVTAVSSTGATVATGASTVGTTSGTV